MAFISIESNNPKLSYIIQKNLNNPEGAIAKTIRKGCGIGWFPYNNPMKFCVRFVDRPQEMSFSDKAFDYLDITALSSPLTYNTLIKKFFSGLLKKGSQDDVGNYITTLVLGFVKCGSKSLQHFTKFFPSLTYREMAMKTYEVRIEGGSVEYCLHLGNLFTLFMMLSQRDIYVGVDSSVVAKYLVSIGKIKCPYYIANLFKVQLLRSPTLFSEYSPLLQGACVDSVVLTYGSTLDARREWINSNLTLMNNIVDIGAGEDFNYSGLSKGIKGLYYPIDRCEEARKGIVRKTNKKGLDKVTEPLEDWDNVKDLLDGDTEVLITEVLEHNTIKEGLGLLTSVLNHPLVKKVLITLPIYEFNTYYLIEDGFRHEDHKWEFTPEFQGVIETRLNKVGGLVYSWHPLGDQINTPDGSVVTPSIGLLITKV